MTTASRFGPKYIMSGGRETIRVVHLTWRLWLVFLAYSWEYKLGDHGALASGQGLLISSCSCVRKDLTLWTGLSSYQQNLGLDRTETDFEGVSTASHRGRREGRARVHVKSKAKNRTRREIHLIIRNAAIRWVYLIGIHIYHVRESYHHERRETLTLVLGLVRIGSLSTNTYTDRLPPSFGSSATTKCRLALDPWPTLLPYCTYTYATLPSKPSPVLEL